MRTCTETAVFLDRDGTLTVDKGYTWRVEDFALLPAVVDGLHILATLGHKLIVVSNQGGVALGRFTMVDVHRFHTHLSNVLKAEGIVIDAYYSSPYHPQGTVPEYAHESLCRKPNPGLLITAAADFDLDLTNSFMVGDKRTDVLAGQRAGCRTVLVLTGCGGSDVPPEWVEADVTLNTLTEAAKWIRRMTGMRCAQRGSASK